MPIASLPGVNACLNGSSALLLLCGWLLIKRRKILLHRLCMVTAFLFSAAFLCTYLYYHYHAGSVRFTGQGPIRTVYFTILISHTLLAIVNLPLILRTLYLALQERFDEHRRAARWAFPVWMYVSVSGVAVYWMLYRL